MPKLYHHEGRWQVPGQQDRKARRVDVPASPEPLAAWLNERDVQPGPWITPAATVTHVATLEPQLAEPCNTPPAADASHRCPKCNGLLCATEAAATASAHSAMLTAIDAWLDAAPLWAIERLAEQVAEKSHQPAGEKLQ